MDSGASVPGRSRPRLADVAARAGVSINTVSRALRAPHTVRPQLRKQIEAVLEELNYVPNRLAGGLAGSSTSVVGVVVTSLFYSEFAATIDAMQERLAGAGLSLMLGNSRYDPDEELLLVRAMLSWRPAALALVGVDHHPRVRELLRAADVPVVEIWDAGSEPIDSAVGMDHLAIGRLQAEHLYERGFRRIAFLGSTREHDYRAQKRRDGYAQVVGERDLHDPIVATAPVGGTPDLGERLLGELLAREPDVDGIVCNGDVIALGVLRGLRRRDRAMPHEIGVVGFGDAEAATCVVPTLTTVRPPRTDVGRIAAATLLARIDGEPPRRVVLPAELIERESTSKPRH